MSLLPRGVLHATGARFRTDKASKSHDYLRLYEFFFAPLRNDAFTLLELGVGPTHKMGASLMTWKSYFPNASIVGVDNKTEARSVAQERIGIEVGDLGRIEYVKALADKYTPRVIVDDASHIWSHQILALEGLFWSLESGGIYILEDVHTSFGERAAIYGRGQQLDARRTGLLECL